MKIFGIGLPKTGTTSLAKAIDILGFGPTFNNPLTWVELTSCQAAVNAGPACHFQTLHWLFPNSLFILTTRRLDVWLESSKRHFRPGIKPEDCSAERAFAGQDVMYRLFGRLHYEEAAWIDGYVAHINRINEHFGSKSTNLLRMNLCADLATTPSEWAPLCDFLNVPVPDIAFPHENKTL